MSEFCFALDRGEAEGFHLDDFEDFDQRQLARFFGMTFRDGSPYGLPEEAVSGPEPSPPTAPLPRSPEALASAAEAAKPAPSPATSGPFDGFAAPPDKLSRFQNVSALFLDLRIAPANPAAEALVEDLLGRFLDLESPPT